MWDASVVAAVNTRFSVVCAEKSCRTCKSCVSRTKESRSGHFRSSVVAVTHESSSEISTAVDLLLEDRLLSAQSRVVKVECVLLALQRTMELRKKRLLSLIVTNKLASEAEIRSQWYVTVEELERFLFTCGLHEITKNQASAVFRILDFNKSGKLHLVELLEGIVRMVAECRLRLRGCQLKDSPKQPSGIAEEGIKEIDEHDVIHEEEADEHVIQTPVAPEKEWKSGKPSLRRQTASVLN